MRLENDRRLALGVKHDEAVRRLRGAEDDLLAAGAQLLRAVRVGEEAAGAPESGERRRVDADLLGRLLERVVAGLQI